ncbi:MAG: D-alanine--D-alanine ligase [Patescibacteria group bacterium]
MFFFKPQKIKVAVLMGGPSSEYEVSLATGKMVAKHLDKKKYEAKSVVVGRDGHWPLPLKDVASNHDFAFVAMHGEYGEDGQLQKQLEKLRLPHTGSDSKVSKLAIDKARTNKLLTKKGLTCPPAITFSKTNLTKLDFVRLVRLGLPLVVKPTDRGSSVGVSVIKSVGQLAPAINNALLVSNNVMIEKFIPGRELTCAVLAGEALLPTEIKPKSSKFFDYKAKYIKGASLEITPPKLPDKIIKNIQKTALKAHETLRCSGYSRTDMILDGDNNLYVLEINTLPGLTKTSLLPQAAAKAGINFSQLLDIIIDNSVSSRTK